eukprot:9710997-Alexandrium_andersonii.AAC.1
MVLPAPRSNAAEGRGWQDHSGARRRRTAPKPCPAIRLGGARRSGTAPGTLGGSQSGVPSAHGP